MELLYQIDLLCSPLLICIPEATRSLNDLVADLDCKILYQVR